MWIEIAVLTTAALALAYWARKYPGHATVWGTEFAWILALLLAGVEIGLNATIEAGMPRQLGVTIGVWVVCAATALPIGVQRSIRRLRRTTSCERHMSDTFDTVLTMSAAGAPQDGSTPTGRTSAPTSGSWPNEVV